MTTGAEVADKPTANELAESRWAVMSERGCEATRLSYEEAVQLAERLRGECLSGLCIITESAASRLPTAKALAAKSHAGNNSKRTRRAAKP